MIASHSVSGNWNSPSLAFHFCAYQVHISLSGLQESSFFFLFFYFIFKVPCTDGILHQLLRLQASPISTGPPRRTLDDEGMTSISNTAIIVYSHFR